MSFPVRLLVTPSRLLWQSKMLILWPRGSVTSKGTANIFNIISMYFGTQVWSICLYLTRIWSFGTFCNNPDPSNFNDEGATVSYQALACFWLGSFMAVVFVDVLSAWVCLKIGSTKPWWCHVLRILCWKPMQFFFLSNALSKSKLYIGDYNCPIGESRSKPSSTGILNTAGPMRS